MEHYFNVEIAKKYGMLEAILIHNIYYWTLKNKANEKHYHNGYYWSYNSIKAFGELFPYVSQRQIQNSLKKLKELGIIITDNFNTSPYDKTLWYTISAKGLSIMQKCQIEMPNLSNRNVKNVEPIPNNKPNNKPLEESNNKLLPKKKYFESEKVNELFNEFLQVRKKLKAVNSDRAINTLINKLNKYDDDTKCEMIEKSIVNSWKDVYELKEKEQKSRDGIHYEYIN